VSVETQTKTKTTDERSEADKQTLREGAAEIIRAVHEEEPLAEILGYDEAFIASVEQNAYKLRQQERFEEAEQLIRGAVALDVTRPYPHLLLGDILVEQDQLEEGEAELAAALELRPDSVHARMMLAEVKMQREEYEAAGDLLEDVIEQEETDEEVRERAEVLLEVATLE
jgi:predicted Zn-dependent protease